MDRRNIASPFPIAPSGAATPKPELPGGVGFGPSGMPPEPTVAPSMEVAHVLFLDLVGYSKLRMNQQAAAQIELQNLVNASAEVQQAKSERKFICRPTGDGMALLFFRDMVSPVRTALQIHALMDKRAVAIRAAVGAEIRLRMGIHSGTVLMVEDLNAQSDAAGDGINIAQRVMDCGDADHILLSSKVAESLLTTDPWQNYLFDLGDVRVKHGVKIHLYGMRGRLEGNLYGNPGKPKKVQEDQDARQSEIKKWRGTFLERNPEFPKKVRAVVLLALFIGVPLYGWFKVPAVKKTATDLYAKATQFGKSKPGGKNAKAGGSNDNGGRGNGGGGNGRGGNGGGGGRSSGGGAAAAAFLPEESSKVPVPDLSGQALDSAIAAARADGLRVVRSPKSSFNKDFGIGQIYAQSPEAGAMVKPGTRIYVRVSKGEPLSADDQAQEAIARQQTDEEEQGGGGETAPAEAPPAPEEE